MFSLISMGVMAAWLYSMVAVLAPGIFPDGFRNAEGLCRASISKRRL